MTKSVPLTPALSPGQAGGEGEERGELSVRDTRRGDALTPSPPTPLGERVGVRGRF